MILAATVNSILLRVARLARGRLALIPLFILLAPLLPLLDQALVLCIAVLLKTVSASPILADLLTMAGLDPVYASVFTGTIGNIEAGGLAVAWPLGEALHWLAPGPFAPPNQVMPGAWATALIGEEISLLPAAIAMVSAETIVIVLGLLLLGAGLRHDRWRRRVPFLALALVGVMLQARAIAGLVSLQFSIHDMEVMGLSHLFTKLYPLDAASYRNLIEVQFGRFAPYVVSSLLIVVIYGAAIVLALLFRRAGRRQLLVTFATGIKRSLRRPHWPPHLERKKLGRAAPFVSAVLAGAVLSYGLFPALANYDYRSEIDVSLTEQADEAPSPAPLPVALTVPAAPVQPPSKVAITGGNFNYTYSVNGTPMKIRGVGYNPMYTGLSREDRMAAYDRDFALMKASHINTILGWDHYQFDDVLLDEAQKYGLGVVAPYPFSPDGDWGAPAYEQALVQDVKAWVGRLRSKPALRMWGLGNEVIHDMGKVPDTPRSRSFAQFYVKLIDEIHAIDPDHPITYRDAEDMYINPIREALKKDGVRRPWFVYGMNFFTGRICQAVPDWPKRELDVPLIISEFAPSGLGLNDRPKGYIQMLRCIVKQNPAALGGFAYVWNTNGPEAIDRVMGLVDANGKPVDNSLVALGDAFKTDDVDSWLPGNPLPLPTAAPTPAAAPASPAN